MMVHMNGTQNSNKDQVRETMSAGFYAASLRAATPT